MLLHLLHVSFPNMPLARPPLHPWQSLSGRWHFLHFTVAVLSVESPSSSIGPPIGAIDPTADVTKARHERGYEFLAAGGYCGSALRTTSSNHQAGFALLDPGNCLRAMVRK